MPLRLSPSIKRYNGDTVLNQSKVKKKMILEESKYRKEDDPDASQPTGEFSSELESHNCLIKVFDKVMVKLQTTESFPL